jgi:hypothetical protein
MKIIIVLSKDANNPNPESWHAQVFSQNFMNGTEVATLDFFTAITELRHKLLEINNRQVTLNAIDND